TGNSHTVEVHMKKVLFLVALAGIAACAEKKPAPPAADSAAMAAPAAAMPADTGMKMADTGMKKDTGMKMAPAPMKAPPKK
ncbi:MAG: hypothetical protein ACREOE_14555, partial [Gemmatimonadales bacterium]